MKIHLLKNLRLNRALHRRIPLGVSLCRGTKGGCSTRLADQMGGGYFLTQKAISKAHPLTRRGGKELALHFADSEKTLVNNTKYKQATLAGASLALRGRFLQKNVKEVRLVRSTASPTIPVGAITTRLRLPAKMV